MKINNYIDATILRANARSGEIIDFCTKSIEYDFAGICINSYNIPLVKKILENNNKLKVISVIGFPLGANSNLTKIMEAKYALEKGADELDVVMNIAAFKDGKYPYVLNELRAIKELAGTKIVKVIIEISLLNQEEIIKASEIVINSGADYIKTSTGFSPVPSRFKDIQFLIKIINKKIKIKVSSGIKTKKYARKLIKMGVDRIGTSRPFDISN